MRPQARLCWRSPRLLGRRSPRKAGHEAPRRESVLAGDLAKHNLLTDDWKNTGPCGTPRGSPWRESVSALLTVESIVQSGAPAQRHLMGIGNAWVQLVKTDMGVLTPLYGAHLRLGIIVSRAQW
jgi:hypothetical protein